jgi:hypothetical protein
MGIEAGISLMLKLMDQLPGLLLEQLHHHSLDIFIQPQFRHH